MTENQFTSIIDFTEIKPAHKFEQFAADVLRSKGFEINIGPAEGPDGGMDMVVTDTLIGRVSTKPVKYLVSCKHLNRAVGTSDEKDLESRVRSLINLRTPKAETPRETSQVSSTGIKAPLTLLKTPRGLVWGAEGGSIAEVLGALTSSAARAF